VTPWLTQPLLAAMLCELAERVRNAVRVFRMLMSCLSGACHADVAPHRLPGGNSGIAKKEQQQHIHADAVRAAMIVAAAVATRSARAGTISPPTDPLIQNVSLPAAPAEPAAAGSKLGDAFASVASSGTSSPWKGEVGASRACDGWGSLRSAPSGQADPHPDFGFAKIGPPPSRGRTTVLASS
jgi:hypothetical protein